MRTFIQLLLKSTVLYYFAQICLTTLYWQNCYLQLVNLLSTENLVIGWDLVFVVAVIILQLLGVFIIIFGRREAWLGAGLLAIFILIKMFIAQDFWQVSGVVEHATMKAEFMNNITLLGGLMLSAIAAEFKYSKQKNPYVYKL